MNNIELVRSYGFEVLDRDHFLAKRGQPFDKLIVRSIEQRLTHHSHVLFDPQSDEQGFMIWGDDVEDLALEAIQFFELITVVGRQA